VIEGTSYRQPCLKVRGKTFANMSPSEPGALVVRVLPEEQALLVAARPDVYYVTPHYEGYGAVLIRLESVDEDELMGRLEDAWELVSTRSKQRR
jgi:hypothetical protein